jgi:hypothetical protein
VNHKRVARIMREDNLLAVQPRQFVVTTKSDHKLEVYLNLARHATARSNSGMVSVETPDVAQLSWRMARALRNSISSPSRLNRRYFLAGSLTFGVTTAALPVRRFK